MVNDVLGWWLHTWKGLYMSQESDNRQKTQASDNSLTKKSKEKGNIPQLWMDAALGNYYIIIIIRVIFEIYDIYCTLCMK